MTVNSDIVTKLKAALFELTYSLDIYKRNKVMRKLCMAIEHLIPAENVSCFVFNKWNLGQQVDSYYSNKNEYYFSQSPIQLFEQYEKQPLISKEVSGDDVHTYILKLPCNDHVFGLILLTFSKNQPAIDQKLLEAIRENSEHLLRVIYNDRNQKFLRHRTQYFSQLSTELHSVHKTTEVLSKMYKTIQLLYPYFNFSLLMSIDYDCKGVPIQLIEYSGEKAQSSGTLAFIENKIKIDYITENNEMRVYSPLAGKQGVYGVVEIAIPQIVNEEELEIDLISDFSKMVGMAIERTTLYQSSNRQVSDLQIINTASHELNNNLESENIIEIVKKYIVETSNAKEVGVIITDDESGAITNSKLKVLGGSTDYFFTENGNKLIKYLDEILKSDPNAIISGNFQTTYSDTPFHSLMVIPMWSTDTIFGFIIMAHPTPYYFTFDKFKFIQSFIQHASLAFKNSVLKEQLRKMATTDYLTKLYSRNYLDKMITKHMNMGGSGTFVLFDVDDFKLVNDTYGHYIGDKVLIKVAKIIMEEVTQTEGFAARWGGEEFAIYFPNMPIDESVNIVDEIRKKVYDQTDPEVTLSCGVSSWEDTRPVKNVDTIEKLFIRADEALYEAKLTGKNRIIQKLYS